MVHMTHEEIAEYRRKKDAEKAKAAEEAAKTEAQRAREESKQKRVELEAALKSRFIASGGTEMEWTRVKGRLIEDALVKMTLEPEPEPEPQGVVAEAPHPRSFYRN